MDRTIEPGKTEEVKISVLSRGRRGSFAKTVRVFTNDARHAEVLLVGKGHVYESMRIKPSTVNFGSITPNSPAVKRTLTLRRGDGGDIAPVLVPPHNPQLSAELREIEHGRQYELDITYSPPWPPRGLRDTLVVKTGVTEVPEERIRVVAHMTPRLQAMPPRFGIPRELPTERELLVRLMWSGGKPGKVLGVECTDPALKVSYEETPRPFVKLTVPANYEMKGAAWVTVRTDEEAAPVLRIPVLRPAPRRGGGAARLPAGGATTSRPAP